MVESDHVTWILASDWSETGEQHWAGRGEASWETGASSGVSSGRFSEVLTLTNQEITFTTGQASLKHLLYIADEHLTVNNH